MVEYWEAAKPGDVERFVVVTRYVANFYAAFLNEDSESLAFLSQHPTEFNPGATMTIEHRPAATASITYEEFVQAVIADRADDAIGKVRELRETQTNHVLLDEEYLSRIVYSLRGTWGLDKEILPVLNFIAELYPTSEDALYMLAEGQIKLGDYSAAIENYNRLLELDPDDKLNYIKPRLQWLHDQ